VDADFRGITTAAMYRALRVAVVIPAFNERRAIVETVATVPELVDDVIVIDDASTDDTSAQAELAALGRARPPASRSSAIPRTAASAARSRPAIGARSRSARTSPS